MRKYMLITLAVLMIAGCERQTKDREILAKINNYEITKQEFIEEFRQSAYGISDTEEAKKNFLESLINRKLVLQEAQREGLDKDKAFLKSIERFWEQSLLKVTLDKKSAEILKAAGENDKETEEAYEAWISGLRKKSDIKIDYTLLK